LLLAVWSEIRCRNTFFDAILSLSFFLEVLGLVVAQIVLNNLQICLFAGAYYLFFFQFKLIDVVNLFSV
jgi:hypothetical protein